MRAYLLDSNQRGVGHGTLPEQYGVLAASPVVA
jgi:hypothetical protein